MPISAALLLGADAAGDATMRRRDGPSGRDFGEFDISREAFATGL